MFWNVSQHTKSHEAVVQAMLDDAVPKIRRMLPVSFFDPFRFANFRLWDVDAFDVEC
jgi:hypothetical protein